MGKRHLSGIINQFLLTILYISVSRIFIILSLVLYVYVFFYQFLAITSGNNIFQVVSI